MEEFFSSTFIILIFFPTFIINKKINLMAYIYISPVFLAKKGSLLIFLTLVRLLTTIQWGHQLDPTIYFSHFSIFILSYHEKRKKKKQLDAFRQWSHSLSTSGKAVRVPRGVPGHTRRPARLPDCGPSAVESLTLALLGPKPLFCPDGWFVSGRM